MNKLVSACVCNQIFSHTHTHIYPESDPRPPESKGSEANFSTRRHFGVEEVRANFGPLRIIITVNINIWLLVGRKTNLHVWLERAMGPDVGHCTKSGREREREQKTLSRFSPSHIIWRWVYGFESYSNKVQPIWPDAKVPGPDELYMR